MGFKGRSNLFFKFMLLTGVLFITSVSALASSVSLSNIEVKQNNEGNYSVQLNLDKFVSITKSSDSADNLNIIIKSTIPSDDMEIVYDNANDLRNVIVQKKNSDNTVISLQGKNVQNAKIYINDVSTGTIKEASNSLNLNKFAFGSFIVFLALIFTKRINKAKKNINNTNKTTIVKKSRRNKKQTINTLNKRNKQVSQNVPSINYRINGSFAAAKQTMTTPKEFIINQYQQEQIRKVG